ncbi:MAG: alpha/beta hydrolase fold, partial [Mycobacterium sp.]|nr:alpha/beta hydrolase fold [Mycobacterium sp.]
MPSIVESADGTRIGYESFGEGPPMLLVHGTSATRIRWAPVRDELG